MKPVLAKRFGLVLLTTMLLGLLGLDAAFGSPPAHLAVSSGSGYVSPTGSIIVVNYFNPPPYPWSSGFHRGVDLRIPEGAMVASPGPGMVTFVGSVFGKPTVSIAHFDGLVSSLEPVVASVAVGDSVSAGTPIGVLGFWPTDVGANSTHCPGQTCLHWGVRRTDLGGDETYLDPLLLLGSAPPIVLLPTR